MKKVLLSVMAMLSFCVTKATDYEPYFPFYNYSYVVYKAPAPVEIDGDIYTPEWDKAVWTENFQDIRGERCTVAPKYRTRAKMLWDDNYLYLAVELEEPHIWATLTERDAVIYVDNDIEFFIDPNGCSSNYFEYEFNANNAQWDLLLTRPPYRGGVYFFDWDAKGMKTAVKVYGTKNNPNDIDQKWTFEAAIPHKTMAKVHPGSQWRLNFSRVEWLQMEIKDGKYSKVEGKTGFGSEENWLWCPTGAVDAHRPERWGWIQFSANTVGTEKEEFNWNNDHEYTEALWTASNRLMQYRTINGKLPDKFEDMELSNPFDIKYMKITDGEFRFVVTSEKGVTYSLDNEGFIKKSFGRRKPNNQQQTQKNKPKSRPQPQDPAALKRALQQIY